MFIKINPSSSVFTLKWVKRSVTFITWSLHWKNCITPVLYGCSFNNFDAVLIVSVDTTILHSKGSWGLQRECSSQTLVSCNFSCVKTDHLYRCYPSINMTVILNLVTIVVAVSAGNSKPWETFFWNFSGMCNRLILHKLFIYRCTSTYMHIQCCCMSVASTQQFLIRNLQVPFISWKTSLCD